MRNTTHLAYQPPLPTGNKYLQQKWDTAVYDLHRRKVMSAKPTLNTTPPKTYSHLTLNLRKIQLAGEWTMRIQRENDMLNAKISHIMKTTGRVENRNYYERKSLSKEKRRQELIRITKDNQMILFRLDQCRPNYNVKTWEEDWRRTLKLRNSIARYPRATADQRKEKEKHIDKDGDLNTTADAATRSPAHKDSGDVASQENGTTENPCS